MNAGAAGAQSAYLVGVANAIKACGSIVSVEPEEFLKILSQQKEPLVVQADKKFLSRNYKYLTSFKGLTFFCKSQEQIRLPEQTQVIRAKSIVIPNLR